MEQNETMKGNRIFDNEIKTSQLFADDSNLVCGELTSMKNAMGSMKGFGEICGLSTLRKLKQWLRKWTDNKPKPLQMRCMNSPLKILLNLNSSLKKKKQTNKSGYVESRTLTLKGKKN